MATQIITLQNKVLIDALKIAKNFNSEGYICFNKEGILIQNTDNANVCLNSILIKADSLIYTELSEETKIFVNFEGLYKLIKSHKSEVTLKLLDNSEYINNKREVLYLDFKGFKSEFILSYDGDDEVKNMPSLEHKINFTYYSKGLKEIIKNFSNISDSVKFSYAKKDELHNLNLSAKSLTGSKSETDILIEEVNINNNYYEEVTSKFSLEYLENYFSNIYYKKQ